MSLRLLGCLLAMGLVSPARAAEPGDRIVRGEDITAWQALEGPTASPTAAELQAFIERFPESPLAELAWEQLRALGPVDARFAKAHRELLADLELSYLTRQRMLERPTSQVTVAPLVDDADRDPGPASWRAQAHVGGVLDDAGLAGALGVGLGRGAWSGIVRGQLGRKANAELVLRLQPERFGQLFVEAGMDARVRGVARAGLASPDFGPFHLDSSIGVAAGTEGPSLSMRLELVGSTGLTRRR